MSEREGGGREGEGRGGRRKGRVREREGGGKGGRGRGREGGRMRRGDFAMERSEEKERDGKSGQVREDR